MYISLVYCYMTLMLSDPSLLTLLARHKEKAQHIPNERKINVRKGFFPPQLERKYLHPFGIIRKLKMP